MSLGFILSVGIDISTLPVNLKLPSVTDRSGPKLPPTSVVSMTTPLSDALVPFLQTSVQAENILVQLPQAPDYPTTNIGPVVSSLQVATLTPVERIKQGRNLSSTHKIQISGERVTANRIVEQQSKLKQRREAKFQERRIDRAKAEPKLEHSISRTNLLLDQIDQGVFNPLDDIDIAFRDEDL